MTGPLEGCIVLVTGAGSGIGRAAATASARAGAAGVALVGRRAGALEQTADEVRAAGAEALVAVADVSNAHEMEAAVLATAFAYGRIDGFFANAGTEGPLGPLAETDPSDFDDVIDTNVRGTFLGLRYVLPVMIDQGSGSIVVN